MRALFFVAALALAAWAAPARADVQSASASAFTLSAEADVAATPEQAYRALTQVNRWWNGAHTYSGDARRLSLDPRAGGCWCERWAGGSVEHMRVVLNMEREGVRTLRLAGGLGPLQQMGVNAVLTFTVAPAPSGAKITMTYRVAGEPGLALDQIAGPVNGVLMEQFGRLSRYSASGSPD